MSDKLSVNALLKELKYGPFVTGCQMPMGYAPGLPLMSVRNGCLCISFPYLKYKMTGERDRTLVYPVRFIITLLLPEGRPVEFRDLSLDPRFAEVNFEKPVGLFRHPAIQHLDKKGYDALRSELLGLYGRLADALLGGSPFSQEDEQRMSELFSLLLEPSLLPIYRALDADFCRKFLRRGE